jgi:hypothetical protein
MDGAAVLGLLKWVAIFLVPASALWGLLGSKPTYEGESGRKYLTRAGLVTVVIITLSALGSAVSFHYQTRIEEQDKARKAADAKQAERDKQNELKDRALGMALAQITKANSVTLIVEQRARAAEDRAERADARARDRELGEKVGVEAARNLERTGAALMQIERVQQPLEELDITIVWQIDADAPGLARIMAPARKKLIDRIAWQKQNGFTPDDELALAPDDTLYPKFDAGDEQAEMIRIASAMLGARFALSATPLDKAGFAAQVRVAAAIDANRDSLLLGVYREENAGKVRFSYLPDGSVQWAISSHVPLSELRRAKAIISYPDLERAYGYVMIDRGRQSAPLDRYIRIARIGIESNSRSYSIDGSRLREIYPDARRPDNFQLPKLSTAKFSVTD